VSDEHASGATPIATTERGDTARRDQINADEPRNLLLLALNTAVIRIGWVFKTESVIIPAFVDSIAGPGWMRGLLPVLNRLGQSIPPFLLARRVKLLPQKRSGLMLANLGMGACFLAIAAGVASGRIAEGTMAAVFFLLLYTLFFSFTGMHMLSLGTLQGKLIRAHRRGRLLAVSTMGGALPAVAFAWWLLPEWLEQGSAGYARIFVFTGTAMVLAGGVGLALREPEDRWSEPAASFLAQVGGAWEILRRDTDYRRLVIVGVLFTTALILMPHYQSLGRERLGLEGREMMLWVVSQNITIGLASVIVGPLADRVGNRLSLRLVMFGSAAIPVLALALSRLEPDRGRELFTLVFIGLGLIPIGLRLLGNYVLELAPESEHPRYLSLAQLCNAGVITVSPLFGWGVDALGYEVVFFAVSAMMLAGAGLTFALTEPRHAGIG
jgi:hypothetical protein